ncbi:MAG: PTS fructose transporter subunit IIA [Gammaproteobacteria bacterium]|nr:PTS fructose transporter subunit IIA [Gammaproteobacteria bacterium]
MSVALLIITHDSIGQSLLETATNMLGICPIATENLSIKRNSNPEKLFKKAQRLCHDIEQGDGLLILTDMYGSTPSNIASRLLKNNKHRLMISGINLPMLVRVMNYPELSLFELANKAKSGAQESIFLILEKDLSN